MTERLRVSELQRCHVVTADGRRLGRVFEVRVREDPGGGPPLLVGLLVGTRGLLRRLGIGRDGGREVPWEAVTRREGSAMIVAEG